MLNPTSKKSINCFSRLNIRPAVSTWTYLSK